MFEFNGKVLATENVAISELIKVVEQIQQSLGSSLPDPIQGPQGEQGAQGAQGEQGPQGFGIIGKGTQLPGYGVGRNGDWFFLETTDEIGPDVVAYKKQNYKWFPQFSMRGAMGPTGPEGGTHVEVNTDIDQVTGIANNIIVDGQNLLINTNNYWIYENDNPDPMGWEIYPYYTYICTTPMDSMELIFQSEDLNPNDTWLIDFVAGDITQIDTVQDEVSFPYGNSCEAGRHYLLYARFTGQADGTIACYLVEE